LAGRARMTRRSLVQPIARRLHDTVGLPRADHAVRDTLRPQRREIPWHGLAVGLRPRLGVEQLPLRLARRLEIAALELGERALREDREARDAFHLVAEELDAHGLGALRREHAENVPSHRQLAAVADTLDARVARRHERGDGL